MKFHIVWVKCFVSISVRKAKSLNQKTSKPEPDGFVANYLLYLLAASSEQASAQFHAEVRKSGLRVPEWRVLACLYDKDGAMITQLASLALVEQSRLTRIIDGMDKRGYVTRRSDRDDGRRVRVYLTDKGREIAGSLVRKATEHEAQVLAVLKDTDAARIKPALKALIAALQPIQEEHKS